MPRCQITKYLGLGEEELTALLGDERERAKVDANSKMAKALFTMATQQNNVAAAIFWMKARAGWRERQEISATLDTGIIYHGLDPFPQVTREDWLARIGQRPSV